MPYSIRLPDGRVVGNIPDDVDPYDAKQQIEKAFPDLAKMGQPEEESGFFRQALDVPTQVGKGVFTGVRMLTDVFGADNPVSQSIRGVEDYMDSLLSAQAKNDQQEIARIMQEAEDKGVADKVIAGARAFAAAPVDLMSQALGTAVPTVAAGLAGSLAKLGALGVRAVQAGVGAATGAGVVKGSIYDAVKDALVSSGESPEVAEAKASEAQSYGGENWGSILAGTALGAVAGSTGIEKMLVDRLAAKKSAEEVAKGIARRAVEGGLKEFTPEFVQAAQEQVAANLALQKFDFDVDTFRGAIEQGTLEGLAGFGLGAGLGAVGGRRAPEPEAPPEVPEVPKTVSSNTYNVIGLDGNPTTVTVTQDELGDIVARDEFGEEADLTNIVSRGISIEDAVKQTFSFEEAPEPIPAAEAAPITPSAAEVAPITPPAAPVAAPVEAPPVAPVEFIQPAPEPVAAPTPVAEAVAAAAAPPEEVVAEATPVQAAPEELAEEEIIPPGEVPVEETPPDIEGVEMRPVEQPPLPLTPEEEAELADQRKRKKDIDARVKELEQRYRALTSRAGKGESLREAVENRLTSSEVVDIGTESYFRKNFGAKKGQEGTTIADLISDHILDPWLPEDLIILDDVDSPETILDKEVRGSEHIKDKLRNRDFRTTAAEREASSIDQELRQILEDIEREAGFENLRDIVTEIYEDEIAKGFEPGESEYEAAGFAKPSGTTRIEKAAQREGAVSVAQPPVKVKTDNPRGEWLKNKQKLSIESGLNEFNVPNRFGSVTATLNRTLLVPVDKLSRVKGMRGEQRAENIRPKSLESLTEVMSSTGRLPPSGLEDRRDYAPFLNIYQDGTPYVNEGNHRIMVAKKLGWKYLPVEVSWFNGAELAGGPFSPEALIADDKTAYDQGFSLDSYGGATPQLTAAQREERAIADRERGLFALQPQVSGRVGAPTADLFGAEGIQQIQPAAPKARSVPAGQLNLFDSDKDLVDNAITERIQKSVGKPVNMDEAKRVEKALKGKDPLQAAKWMAANATRPDFQLIAKRVVDRMQKMMDAGIKFKLHVVNLKSRVPVRMLTSNGITSSAVNQTNKRLVSVDIWLNGTDVTGRIGTDEETVLHELIHAVTAGANYLGTFKDLSGTEAAKLATRLNDVRNAVVKHFNSRVTTMPTSELSAIERRVFVNNANALEDGDEVLAWGLTDPDMQEYLESIPYKGKTAWDSFVDAIREFLGLPKAKETALSEVLAISDLLFKAPLIEAGQADVAAAVSKPTKPISADKQIQLLKARSAGLNNTQRGKEALNIVETLGRGAKPEKTKFDSIRDVFVDDRGNTKITPENAKKQAVRFLDRVETWGFTSDAALNNAIRREIADTTMSQKEKIGALLSVSSSQAVHADGVASLFMRYGGINYNPETYKYEAVDRKDNLISLVRQIDNLAKTYNIDRPQAERVAHTAFEAKRLRSLQEANETLDGEISALRSSMAKASRSGDEKTRLAIAREIRRKVKDYKFIHMTKDEIDAGLRLIELMPKEMNDIINTWNGIRRSAAKELVQSGLWSEAEADSLLSNMDYVPFYREDQLEKGKGPKEFLRSLQVQAKEKKLKGSSLAVNDIFDNMARWTQYAVKRSVINRLALAKIDAAKDFGFAKKMEKSGPDTVRVWRDGEAEYYRLDDPMFMEAFAGLEPISIPTWKIAAKISSFLRQSVVLNPIFSLSQVPQDAIAAIYTSGLKPRYALTIPARAVKEFVKTLFGVSKTHKDLERIAAVGIRDFTSSIARTDAEVVAGLKAPPGVWGKVKNFLEHVSMASDNAVRQAVYEASIAQGVSRAEALEKAFQLINFRNRGSSKAIALAGQVIPFFNAYMAAQHVALKVVSGVGISPSERKEALKTLIYTTAAVQALALVYAMMMDDDEEYKATPSIIRDRLLMIPGIKMSIPIRPDIFSIPKILTEHTYMLMTDQGSADGRKFRDSLKAALGNAILGPTPVPQAIKPLAEVGINYNFFQGRPLVGTYQKGLETERQFNDSTSEFAKWLGSSGMVSPIAADHLIRGMFGSVGGLGLLITNQLIHNDPDVPRPEMSVRDALASLPGTTGFVRREYETGIKNDFYVLRDEVSKVVNTLNDLKARSPHEIEEFLAKEKNVNRLGMQKAVNKITDNLSKIRREISRISQAENMSAREKQEAIKYLREIEQEMLSGVNVKELRRMADL